MATLRKTILPVGTHHTQNGELLVTPQRLRHWGQTFRTMSKRGLTVPSHWDHSDNDKHLEPITLSAYEEKKSSIPSAATSIGRMVDFKVDPTEKFAEITMRYRDEKAAEALEEGDVFLSPVIIPRFRDGAKNRYRDVIGCVDVVDYPVNHKQGPAKRIDDIPVLACALRLGSDPGFYRPEEDEEEEDDSQAVADDIMGNTPDEPGDEPPADEAPADEFSDESDESADEFGDDEFADEGDETSDIDSEAVEDDYDAVDDEDFEDPAEIDVEGNERFQLLINGLNRLEITMPEDTTEANFQERLLAAVTALNGPEEEEAPGMPASDDMGNDTIVADPQIMTMSLQRYAENQRRKSVSDNLGKLLKTGRCTPAEFDYHKNQAAAIKLSLNAEGKPKATRTDQFIADRKAVPAGTFWSPEKRIKKLGMIGDAIDHPDDIEFGENSQMSDKQASKLAEQILGG